jgi:ATP-dependent DNA ligase
LEIYSRRMHQHHHTEGPEHPWTQRFPHLVEEFYDLNIPANSIILGEMVTSPEDDNRWYVAQVMKSKTKKSLLLQAERGNLHFYIWDIAQWDGEELLPTVPALERLELAEEVFGSAKYFVEPDVFGTEDIRQLFEDECGGALPKEAEYGPIIYPPHYPVQWKRAVAVAMALGWEGWVVVDPHSGFGDKSFTFLGKDYRPREFSAKIKPDFEDDFIARFDPENGQGSWGRGKRTGTIGAVALFQLDDKGEEHYICECGGGISDEFAAQYSNTELFPMVLKVQYATRTYARNGDETNALQFPRIVGVRTDKDLDECINPRLTPREKCGACKEC